MLVTDALIQARWEVGIFTTDGPEACTITPAPSAFIDPPYQPSSSILVSTLLLRFAVQIDISDVVGSRAWPVMSFHCRLPKPGVLENDAL